MLIGPPPALVISLIQRPRGQFSNSPRQFRFVGRGYLRDIYNAYPGQVRMEERRRRRHGVANRTLFAAVYADRIFTSHHQAPTFTAIGSPVPTSSAPGNHPSVTAILPAAASGTTNSTLYAAVNLDGTSGFCRQAQS